MDNIQIEDTTITNPDSLQAPLPAEKKKPVGLIVAMVICVIVAIGGIAFGVFSFMDSNQKSQEITSLKTEIDNKNNRIIVLEDELLEANSKIEDLEQTSGTNLPESDTPAPESEPINAGGNVSILLDDVLDANDERIVFKIGECTYDGGASATSVKCPVVVNGKNGLISSNIDDSLLRLVIPNN